MKYVIATILLTIYLNTVFTTPVVETVEGTVSGAKRLSRKGREIVAFYGIPYAEPPIGNLRFHNPIPKKPWNGTLKADKEGKHCIPYISINPNAESEDCLFLNVYTPQLPDDGKSLLPVIVFIHGGAYLMGSSSTKLYAPDYFMDKDIILVSMNYRLGIFGFLSTGDEAAPGNFALKDQVLSFKWVQRNIRAFGGDPNNVTLYGHSAGAGSVYHHILSNRSNHLFKRCIIQCIGQVSPILYHGYASYYSYAKKVAELYNCPTTSSSIIVNCLRNLSTSQLQNTTSIFNGMLYWAKHLWGVTVESPSDEAFLSVNLTKHSLSMAKDVPTLMGFTLEEGLTFTSDLYINDEYYQMYRNDPATVIRSLIESTVPCPSKRTTQLIAKLKDFYLGRELPTDKTQFLRGFTKMYTDIIFFRSFLELVHSNLKYNKEPLYTFIWKYRGALSATLSTVDQDPETPASHIDQLFYLFPVDGPTFGLPDLQRTENDYKIVDFMINAWTSFAETGVPTSPGVHWEPHSLNKAHLQIGNYSEPVVHMVKNICKAREKFIAEIIPSQFVIEEQRPTVDEYDSEIITCICVMIICLVSTIIFIRIIQYKN